MLDQLDKSLLHSSDRPCPVTARLGTNARCSWRIPRVGVAETRGATGLERGLGEDARITGSSPNSSLPARQCLFAQRPLI
jgi:hypothetical protein